jgi:hypothetical protein
MTLGRGFINRLSIYPIPQFSIGGVPGGHERWQDGIGSKGFLPDSEDDGDDDGEGNGDDKEEEDVGELLWEAQVGHCFHDISFFPYSAFGAPPVHGALLH